MTDYFLDVNAKIRIVMADCKHPQHALNRLQKAVEQCGLELRLKHPDKYHHSDLIFIPQFGIEKPEFENFVGDDWLPEHEQAAMFGAIKGAIRGVLADLPPAQVAYLRQRAANEGLTL